MSSSEPSEYSQCVKAYIMVINELIILCMKYTIMMS